MPIHLLGDGGTARAWACHNGSYLPPSLWPSLAWLDRSQSVVQLVLLPLIWGTGDE